MSNEVSVSKCPHKKLKSPWVSKTQGQQSLCLSALLLHSAGELAQELVQLLTDQDISGSNHSY